MTWLENPAHGRWLEAECDRLLAFGRRARHPDGGFAWLDDAGVPDPSHPRELWVTCRMTHVYALGHLMGRPDCTALVDHGVDALSGIFHDAEHDGWYAKLGPDGPTETGKTAYEHAFVVLAGASATAAGRVGGLELLHSGLSVLLEHFWDDEHGMVVEEWDESFSTLDGYRGVNANMHTVEALLAAADVLDDQTLREKAQRIVTRVVHGLAPEHSWRIPEHFDASWTPRLGYNEDEPAHPFRPYGATIGHWLEWSRLALHLRAALGDSAPEWLLDRRTVALRGSRRGGVGRRRAGRVRLHRGLERHSRRTRADALGGRRGHCRGRSPARRDGRFVLCGVVRDVVEPHRRVLHRPGRRVVVARAVTSQRAEQQHLGGQARHLPRPAGDADPSAAAQPLPGKEPGWRVSALKMLGTPRLVFYLGFTFQVSSGSGHVSMFVMSRQGRPELSIVEAAKKVTGATQAQGSPAPYKTGDRIVAVSPEGIKFLAKVEVVSPASPGKFNVMGAIVEPRRFRGHLLSTVVSADGSGPAIHAA